MTATLISSFVAGKHLNSAPSVPGRPELRNHGTQRLDVDVRNRTEPVSFAVRPRARTPSALSAVSTQPLATGAKTALIQRETRSSYGSRLKANEQGNRPRTATGVPVSAA